MEDISQKISDLESQYKEIDARIIESRKKLQEQESAMLVCLQKLMPLQNSYLTSIINTLQKQLQTKNLEVSLLNKKLSEPRNNISIDEE